ncbi:hypothetical protein FHU38_004412 [Saccharomonospora amisosensis]|uniref:Cell wall-active antibiotics response LiaF-like C-terminal domain-containing protein n=1 Tax=Saccharomonospora amisosensis TaxID=1128677 RepID=A0A7X5UUQ0_9PSEU|nr:DUF1707 domain-containing protein [Saccharomonospora amisosensis]NIJ14068.1 hypothetical protein [Saccharomonospora amisosensis]
MTEQPQRPDPKQLRASDADRERVAQLLHNAMSEGRITMAELEERLGTVYAAKTLGELEPVLVDLPGASVSHTQVSPAAAGENLPDRRIGGTPGSTFSIGVLSGATRKGNWVLPTQHNSFAFWGGVEIDLRNARFAEKHCTITAVAIMGGIDIVVPDDIVVDVTGIGFMGAFETKDKQGAADSAPEGAPVVKINGLALMGGVEVKRVPRDRKRREGQTQLE